jgi:hypothetical protein
MGGVTAKGRTPGVILPAQPNINAEAYERLRLKSGQMRTLK